MTGEGKQDNKEYIWIEKDKADKPEHVLGFGYQPCIEESENAVHTNAREKGNADLQEGILKIVLPEGLFEVSWKF